MAAIKLSASIRRQQGIQVSAFQVGEIFQSGYESNGFRSVGLFVFLFLFFFKQMFLIISDNSACNVQD